MNSKKAITLLLLTSMLFSLIPIVSVSGAVTDVEVQTIVNGGASGALSPGGVYDETYAVVGDGVTAGKVVELYWDAVQPWDGEAGLLNSSKAEASGEFETWFDVPEAVSGNHYLWIVDTNTGEAVRAETGAGPVYNFVIDQAIELSPDSGLIGDEVTVNGYGYEDEEGITVYTFDGAALTTVSPSSIEADELGSWEATFDVPTGLADATYAVVFGSVANQATADFDVGPAITLNVEEGPVGTVVTATGRGFTASVPITGITIEDGAANTWDCTETDDDDLDIDSDGEFRVSFVIPEVDSVNDDYEIEITDGAKTGTADFEVTGLAEISFEQDYAIQGSTVTIYGYNFTAIAGEEVVVSVGASEVGTFETDRNGYFEGTFKVPGLTGDTYTVTAEQADWGIDNVEQDKQFRVGLVIVVLNPEEGTTGTRVTMTGSGFEDANTINATFGNLDLIDTGGVDLNGGISEEFTVPTVDAGTYTIVINEVDADEDIVLSVEVEFTVTERTMITTSPVVAPNDYNVTIEGWYFSESYAGWNPTLTFVIYNETDDWDLPVWADADTTPDTAPYEGTDQVELMYYADWDDDHYFKGWFMVPDEDTLSLGTYTINATDDNDLIAQIEFTIVDKTVSIDPRKSVFSIGDTVAFNVESSFAQEGSYIKIWDPSGNQYWKTDPFVAGEWIEVDTIVRVPYYEQVAGGNPMTLLEDAPLGTWEWTWYDVDDEELDTGSFTVEAAAADVIGEQVADLNNQITDLADQLSDVTAEFDDVKSDIADVAAIAEQAVAAAQQAAEAVQTVAQTANTASQAASDAAEAANAARDAANGLTTLVYGAIGAALVAALAAIVSLMQISRRIAG